MVYSHGLIEEPPTYFDALEPSGGSSKPPMVLICGGAHIGACYRDRRILVMPGTEDADHPRQLDEGIATFFNQHGAKADFIYLGDRGIVGNGHMMMLERNSDTLAALVVSWLEQG